MSTQEFYISILIILTYLLNIVSIIDRQLKVPVRNTAALEMITNAQILLRIFLIARIYT